MSDTQISARGGWPTVSPPFLALRFLNLLAATIALEISYMDSPKNPSHESKSHVFKIDE